MRSSSIKDQRKREFIEKVFPVEIDEVRKRRANVNIEIEAASESPTTDNELVGLAISGGGIRSATFSLGVVQAMAAKGLLKRIDYISTVSGGGFTGSCLSSLLNDNKNKSEGKDFPLRFTAGSEEPPSLTHLRNSSNYLTPGGLFEKLRLPNMLLRGILLNLFIFMPFIMAAVFITEVAYEIGPNWDDLTSLLLPLSFLFLLMSIAFPFAIRILRRRFNWSARNAYELWLAVPLLLIGAILVLVPLLSLTRAAIEHNTGQVLFWVENLSADALWKSGALAAGVAVLFMFVGKASQNLARWSSKILMLVVGLLGPVIVFIIYLLLCLWQIDSPYIPAASDRLLNQAIDCEEPCLYQRAKEDATSNAALLDIEDIAHSLFQPETEINTFSELLDELEGRSINLSENAIVRCQSGNCAEEFPADMWHKDNRVWVINDAPEQQSFCPLLQDVEPGTNAGIIGNCHYLTRDSSRQLRIEGDQLQLFDRKEDLVFLLIFIGLLIFNRVFLDMNITSLHGFYRDRLSKAYLFNVDENNEIVHADKIKLSSLNADGTTAPYHIINVALNLQGSTEPDLRGRKSDFFIFSKHFIGSERTGFTPTKEMEIYDRHMDLGTAMAISGGAAAPNMGTTTVRSLVFILTLLNIRLGYWLPNPQAVNSRHWLNWLRLGGAKPTLIWREALGKIDAKGTHVNVSDGGHIENLGIYPLLKRRCKYIIAIDGEADPNMTFGGLVKLMRFARIDIGIEIEIDLDKLRKDPSGYSKSHSVVGDIKYSNGEIGKLLYIKLSVTGSETEYVRAYRQENPAFPHQPTSDQFFSEDQFEAYRALGFFAGRVTFDELNSTANDFQKLINIGSRQL